MLIGERIRTLRLERCWSLSQMSEQIHYSRSYLSRIENGTRFVSLELAELFDQIMGTQGELAELVAAEPQPQGRKEPQAQTPSARTRPVPAELPAIGEMWGRDSELARVEALITRHPGPAVVAVDGRAE
ncbi:helix-turn-helix transcriptional regulator [Streptacidiphilus sp. 4-A2]|nr:helix-turn-helix transcriptional regulator [Streptacidiphilus sp. 4-A2]